MSAEIKEIPSDIKYILEQALRAPSGDNTQPWHWVVSDYTLELWHTEPEGFIPKLFWGNKKTQDSTYLAFGTMIENLSIAASAKQYEVSVSYFPDQAKPLLAALVTLSKNNYQVLDSLFEALPKRMTTRSPYLKTPLRQEDRAALLGINDDKHQHHLQLIENPNILTPLLKFITVYDELLFSNKHLHERFYSLVNWTKEKDEERRVGFHASTLGATGFSLFGMRLLQNWWLTHLGKLFGLPKFVAHGQRALYEQSSAFGVISSQGDSAVDWIEAGRFTQRIWLTANNRDLSFQPMNGTLLLTSIAGSEQAKPIIPPAKEMKLMQDFKDLQHILHTDGKTINFIFRIGYGQPVIPTSLRKKFEDMVEVKTQAPYSHTQ